ncbi:MAG: ATP-binding protein [Lachnospiraceae bacterium]|nr:ATP-binding protein [Lachnospiraceae bacterium]
MKKSAAKLPIGIQSFEHIINEGYTIIDKTEFIYKLAHEGIPYFLSRPRRFGKSLLLSTMKAYWEGKKELFDGLKIQELEKENADAWQAYPVFYFDFNKANFKEKGILESILEVHLREWEEIYGKTYENDPLGVRFGQLMRKAYDITGKRCVVLVDEYDKPLIETLDNVELVEHNKAVFKGFFSTLKGEDAYIRFVFITGVTKFSKVSIFSDLNQLRDISMSSDYAEICGITEEEMKDSFPFEIETLANEHNISIEECLEKLKETYDGYRFHQKGKGVYNPFSLLSAFADRDFDSYWFETGTPTFLVEKIKNIDFDVRKFTDGTLYATKQMLKDYRDDNPDIVPLLYQSGYITLKEYNSDGSYTLTFPNEEVKYGFLESLLPQYVQNVGAGSGKDILTLNKYIETGNLDGIRNVFTALFASIPYPENSTPFEHDFQSVIYITFELLGKFARCESHTYQGRIDCLLETKKYVYIFEFKRDGSADEALKQIEDMHYTDIYSADKREIFKIGINFDSKTRQISDWKTM